MCSVLVVDDQDEHRFAVREMLCASGHTVDAVADGTEALAWLSSHADQPPCVIVLDLRMPAMDGWDFLDAFRKAPAWANLPVIVLSAMVKAGNSAPLLKAQAFWPKPVDPRQLQEIHHHCATHHQSWPPPQGAPPVVALS
jgi:CheY-like chemotaxis protein